MADAPSAPTYRVRQQDHKLYIRLDNKFIDQSEPALTKGLPVHIECDVTNTDRALGTTLSYRVSKLYGEEGLPRDTIHINMKGSAGQSCGAFLAPGITIKLEGGASDYVGKASLEVVSLSTPLASPPSRLKRTSSSVTSVCTARRPVKLSFVVLRRSASLCATLERTLLWRVPATTDAST